MKTKRKLIKHAKILQKERRQNALDTAKRCVVQEKFEYEPVGEVFSARAFIRYTDRIVK